MSKLSSNLLIQFSVASFVIMAVLAVALAAILTTRLNRNVDLLKEHGAAMMSGTMIMPSDQYSIPSLSEDVRDLRWITVATVGGGFVFLYGGLVLIVWGGWRTITRQRASLESTNVELSGSIDEVRAANQELHEAQERLVRSERLAAIGELSAGVAHELRNPLGAIKNALYYINGRLQGSDLVQDTPRIGEFLEIMDEEVDSSDKIITDLMDFSRVNPPSVSPTKLEAVLDDALSRMELKESVNVTVDFEPEIPEASVDGEQIRRVFTNLIMNAADAMPEGGNLTVTGRAVDGSVRVEIRDTGHGISEDDLQKVFDPLFTTKARGIGMGLPIVGTIIERHTGTIEVSSKEGEGTTFTIRLPLTAP